MNVVYIYNHLGLGDHIIVNGLIRTITKDYDKVFIFVKKRNLDTVKKLYFDKKYNFIIVNSDIDVDLNKNPLIKIGFEYMNVVNCKFDESFYNQFGIPFEYRWSKFKMYRDKNKEMELFDKYNIEENNYIFLHDDPKRGFIIDRKLLTDKNIKIITPISGLTNNIIDYCYIIENAKEIHCMDSSFRLLIDSINNLKVNKLYYHVYVRGYSNINISNSKYNWFIIPN